MKLTGRSVRNRSVYCGFTSEREEKLKKQDGEHAGRSLIWKI